MFESAHLKIERAKQHIGEITVEVRFREKMPSSLALIIGDSIHNLRTALDHATWELIGMDGGTQDRHTKLPTGDDEISHKAFCKGIKTPRNDTKEFFIALGTYKGGTGNILYALNLLDNADKHTVLTPIISICSIPLMKVVRPDGVVVTTLQDCRIGMGPDGRARIMKMGPGLSVEFDQNADPAIDIFFGNVYCFHFNPIIQTLVQLGDAVTHTVGQFEIFVRDRH